MSNFYTTIHPCRRCNSPVTERVPRPLWMRVMPNTLRMRCSVCGCQFSARMVTPRRVIEL
jgi:hypothetical protein